MLKLLDISKIFTQLKESTHAIYWLTKWQKNNFEKFTDQMKKAKKVTESCNWTLHKWQH